MKFKFEQTFDNIRFLQYINGHVSVLHCHHYSTIFTKLALDMPYLDGPGNLFKATEDTVFLVLNRYFMVEKTDHEKDRIFAAEQYFAMAGLGHLQFSVSANGGNASMKHSHVDEGWLKKWGKHKRPVNLIGQGYLAGACSAIYHFPVDSFSVRETESIVCGSQTSEFAITRK